MPKYPYNAFILAVAKSFGHPSGAIRTNQYIVNFDTSLSVKGKPGTTYTFQMYTFDDGVRFALHYDNGSEDVCIALHYGAVDLVLDNELDPDNPFEWCLTPADVVGIAHDLHSQLQ